MRLAPRASVLSLLAVSLLLTGCPDKQEDKGAATAEKPEVERAEPDDDAKVEAKPLAPAAAAPAAEKKEKEEGGW